MSAPRKRTELRLVVPITSAGLTPPHNLDAEAAVLSAVLLKPDSFDAVTALLDVSSWYSEPNRIIWQAIERVRAAGSSLDLVTVATRLKEDGLLGHVGGSAYLAQIVDATPAIANVVEHATIVASLGRRRLMIGTLQQLAAEGYRDVESDAQWLAHCEEQVGRVRREKAVSEDVDIITSKEVMLRRLSARQSLMIDGKRPGIPTGIEALDAATGGLHGGQLLMLSGPKKGFKTTFAMQLAVNVAQTSEDMKFKRDARSDEETISRRRGVLIVGMEQPHEELTETIAYQMGKVNRNKFQTGVATYEDFDAARRATAKLDKLPIRFACKSTFTPSELRAAIARTRAVMVSRGCVLRLLVIDYLQLMTADPDTADPRNREAQIDVIGQTIRALSQEPALRDTAIVALSQLNEDGELRGSRSTSMHCVSWWDLNVDKSMRARDSYRPHTMPAKLTIKLQRHGPSPLVVPLWCHSDVGAFDDGQA